MSASGFPQGHKDFHRYLGKGVGYGVVVGIGAFFAVLMIILTRLQKRFTRLNPDQAEEFVSASQSIKPGLICCGIVSAWTWSATLLQSSSATYLDGASAAWWYGVGGTIQITFFAAVAAKVKQNASGAVTFPQIVKARYGTPTFLLFTFYALLCAHTVTGALILGASASINSLTGADIIACNFLLPIGIAIYVVAGGLRATFLVDYLHTAVLFIVIYVFVFVIYGTSNIVGSPGKLWDLLQTAATLAPAAGNAAGSYTTLKSNPGIVFAANSICSGFGGVFCDQGYWQRAIASRPESTSRAYVLGGLAWFAIPWVFGTVMGLTGRALLTDPGFPTFPYALWPEQVGAGLVAPATAVTVMGTGGAVAVLLVVFMAATSATSAELIAVSSIITFDVCGVLWKPIRGKQAVLVSHIVIAVFAVWAGAWSTILYKVNINLGWLYYVQGVFLAPAVFPIAMTVVWKKQSKSAAFFGTLIGTVTGLIGWFVGCWKIYGSINITNLALPYSAISGEAPGLVCSTIGSIAITFLRPDNFDWSTTRAVTISELNAPTGSSDNNDVGKGDADIPGDKGLSAASIGVPDEHDRHQVLPADRAGDDAYRASLQRAVVRSTAFSLVFAMVVGILIPLPMFFTDYIFSRRFFEVWVGLSIVWALIAGGFCILLPLWESRKSIALLVANASRVVKAMYAKEASE